jgi:uncharacterized protein YbgA (DUF1722 family)/uncharacterized protein YbbK (DUF523 family)
MTTDRIRLGISTCLLGEKVRYDGQHKLDRFLADTLGRWVEWVPVCPEVECGLPIPREAMHLAGVPAAPRLVTIRTGVDHTQRMQAWATTRIRSLEREDLCGYVFKSRSPSSGMQGIKVYSAEGMPVSTKGVGLWARAFMERFPLLPVEDDGRLHDPALRENFLERVFVHRRWKEFVRQDGSLGGLVDFHTDHKLLVMAHSPGHYRELGRLVAAGKRLKPERLREDYLSLLTAGLKMIATTRKNANVLQHMLGYFKKTLDPGGRAELLEVIGQYQRELVPLIVPITLFRHHIRRLGEPYLGRQVYLNPTPLELMLRNHV